MYTKEQLKEQIQAMGILPSDTVLMHSSMKKIGAVEDGPDGVIDAFCEYLSEGMYMVPTHTWAVVGRTQPIYDVNTTVPNIGLIPRTAAFRKDGIRSLHPTHSIWAHGEGAVEFVKGEELVESPGAIGGAWGRLAEVGAKILLVGVGNNRNTFIHAVDEAAEYPDRISKDPYDVTVQDYEGKEYTHPFHGHSCSRSNDVSRQFVNFEKALIELGAETFGQLGHAEVRIVDAAKCMEIIKKIFKNGDRDVSIRYMEIPDAWYR
jgi:aminoglycoside 3-N-acetyltransferase